MILSRAPSHRLKQKLLEAYFIKQLNLSLNNQLESEILTLFRHGVTQLYNRFKHLFLFDCNIKFFIEFFTCNIALKMLILTKNFAFNIFKFLILSYSFVIIHGRYIVQNSLVVEKLQTELNCPAHSIPKYSTRQFFQRKLSCRAYSITK